MEIERAIEVLKEYNNCKAVLTEELEDATDLAIPALEKQNNNGWIPVSERLPNKAGRYLVFNSLKTIQEKDLMDYHTETEIMYFSFKHKKFNTNSIVMAWQPLPESYKEA